MQDKRLLAFPIMSGIVSVIVMATFLLPLFFPEVIAGTGMESGVLFLIGMLFVLYVVCYVIVIFFNTALVACVNARLNNYQMSIMGALLVALRHIFPILGWALISATVGVLLQILEDRAGFVGQIGAILIGGLWWMVTFFVVPIFVLEDKGVFDAMKDSFALIKKTWGESIIGAASITIVFVLIGLAVLLLTAAVSYIADPVIIGVVYMLVLIFMIVLGVVASTLQGIFVTAAYTFAKTGNVPPAFERDLIASAFLPKSGQTQDNI